MDLGASIQPAYILLGRTYHHDIQIHHVQQPVHLFLVLRTVDNRRSAVVDRNPPAEQVVLHSGAGILNGFFRSSVDLPSLQRAKHSCVLVRGERDHCCPQESRLHLDRFITLGGIHLTGVRRDPHQCSAADRHGRFAPGRSRLVGCPRRLGGSGGSFLGRRLAMRSWKRIGSWATASSSPR